MGWVSDVGKRIREFFKSDKENLAYQMAKGVTSSSYPVSGFDILQAYGYDVISDYLRLEHDLLSRYVDYEEMDDYPEISAAIDIYADDATVPDTQLKRTMWVEARDPQIEQVLDDLYHRTLRADEDSWEIARTLVKYGNDFEEILVTQDGVRGLNFLPPPTVRRIEGPKGELFGFVQDFKGRFGYSPQEFQQILAMRTAQAQGNLGKNAGLGGLEKIAALEGWEVAHFRLRGKHRRSLYGYSVLEPARWIWKRLMLLEDAALIFRLQRAPERYAFYVDVGDLPPHEALAQVNRIRQQHKKRKFYNPTTGKLDLKWEPLSQDDDFWVPTRAGADGTRIEVLGSPSWQHMDDIEYFRDKLFAAIKVPKAYMGQEEGVARAVLSSEDVRFARTVLRIQRAIRTGMAKVGRVHLAALNIDPEATEWDLVMTVPSSIFELAQLEVRNARADLANRMRDFVSLRWILSNVFGLNDSEIENVVKQRKEDVLRDSDTQSEAEAASQKKIAMSQAEAEADINDQFGPPEGEEGAPPGELPPGEEAPAEAKARLAHAFLTERARRARQRKLGPISEQELLRGENRETERRAQEKFEQLMAGDRRLEARLKEIGGMLHDLAGSRGSRR